MVTDNQSYRIKGFDGLRALAVIMVWLEHRTSLNDTEIGGAGVNLFFVLSGFLIVDIIRRQRENIEHNGSNRLREWKIFFFRRAYRIFPIYFIFLFFIVILDRLFRLDYINITSVIMHLFYLVNFWVNFVWGHWNSTTTHLWSLSVEEQFYIFFPIIALNIPSKNLPIVCAIIICLSLALRVYLWVSGSIIFAIDSFSFVAFGRIALGGLFVLLFANRTPQHGRTSTFPAMLLVTYIIMPVLVTRYGSPSVIYIFNWIPMTLLIGIILVIIQKNQSSILVKILEFSPLRSIGIVSYGFYVYHYPFSINNIDMIFHTQFNRYLPHVASHAIEFILPLLAATLSWRYIEKPILKRRPSAHDGPHELPSDTMIDAERI